MAAPKGNRFAAHDKPWTRALQKHVAQNPDLLRRIAIKTFDKALEGDAAALRELADRLDGKPIQAIEMSGSLEHNRAEDLSDNDLANIATAGSTGTSESTSSPQTTH